MGYVVMLSPFSFKKGYTGCMNKQELANMEPMPQRQDSLYDQMVSLELLAVKFGLYDASDWVRKNFFEFRSKYDGG